MAVRYNNDGAAGQVIAFSLYYCGNAIKYEIPIGYAIP